MSDWGATQSTVQAANAGLDQVCVAHTLADSKLKRLLTEPRHGESLPLLLKSLWFDRLVSAAMCFRSGLW
jgi:hypothetical protein